MGQFRVLKIVVAAVLAAALSACGGNQGGAQTFPDAYQAAFDAQPTAANSADFPQIQADFAALNAVLTAESATQGDDGAMVLTNVMISASEDSAIGLRADEITIIGANFGLLAAHIAGEDVGDGGLVFSRLDAKGLEVVGLETLYQPLMDEMQAQMDELQAGLPDDGMPDPMMMIDTYEISASSLSMAGFEIHPREAITPLENGDEDFATLQQIAREMRAISLDVMVMEDMVTSMNATQYDDALNIRYVTEFMGYLGLNRGDVAAIDMLNTDFQSDMPFPIPDEAVESGMRMLSMDATGQFGTYLIEDIRLSRALSAIIDGQFIPTTETDTISFGRWTMKDLNYAIDGRDFFALTSMVADFTESHWILPELITVEFDGLVYDYGAMAPLFMEMIPAEEVQWDGVPEQILAILDKYNILSAPSDFNLTYRWAPDGGGISLDMAQETEGFGAFDFAASAMIPAYDEWAPNIPLDGSEPSEDISKQMEKLFMRESAYEALTLTLRDTGGLDAYFNAAVEIADILPIDDNPQLETFAQYDAASLRQMLSGVILMGGGQANREVPGAGAWAGALATFVREGGAVTFEMSPPEPLSAARISAIEDQYGGTPPPNVMIETLGISVTHTAE